MWCILGANAPFSLPLMVQPLWSPQALGWGLNSAGKEQGWAAREPQCQNNKEENDTRDLERSKDIGFRGKSLFLCRSISKPPLAE